MGTRDNRIRAGWVALAVSVATTAAAIPFGAPVNGGIQLPLFAVALVAFSAALAIHRRTPFLTRRVVLGASGVLLLVAVVVPPRASKDLWAYAMYGRIVTVHDASPYVHRPSEYGSDPALARMATGWRHSRSVYGPAFTGVSAAGAALAGDSPLATRLFFQLLGAGAVLAALVMLARRNADSGALAFVGINPVVVAIVAGGHNDLLVGVAVLAGVLAATRGRATVAGGVLALAVLVKISAVLLLVAVVAWLAARRGWAAAARAGVTAAGTVVVGYVLAGGVESLGPLRGASAYRSKASVWDHPAAWMSRHVFGSGPPGADLITAATVAVGVLTVVLVAARVRDLDPAVAAGGAGLVYLLGAAYVLPWYAGWVLPVLALAWRSRLALVAQLQAGVLLLVYVDRPGVRPELLHDVVDPIATRVVPIVEIALLAALLVVSLRRIAPLLAAGRVGSRARVA